jgi:hypothetical protein
MVGLRFEWQHLALESALAGWATVEKATKSGSNRSRHRQNTQTEAIGGSHDDAMESDCNCSQNANCHCPARPPCITGKRFRVTMLLSSQIVPM